MASKLNHRPAKKRPIKPRTAPIERGEALVRDVPEPWVPVRDQAQPALAPEPNRIVDAVDIGKDVVVEWQARKQGLDRLPAPKLVADGRAHVDLRGAIVFAPSPLIASDVDLQVHGCLMYHPIGTPALYVPGLIENGKGSAITGVLTHDTLPRWYQLVQWLRLIQALRAIVHPKRPAVTLPTGGGVRVWIGRRIARVMLRKPKAWGLE